MDTRPSVLFWMVTRTDPRLPPKKQTLQAKPASCRVTRDHLRLDLQPTSRETLATLSPTQSQTWPAKIPHFRRKPHSRAHLHSRPPHASGLWPFRGRFDELPQGKPASNEISTGVLHERKTRFVQAVRLPNKTAKATAEAGMGLLKKLPRQARKSLTLDNGGAFAKHTLWRKHLRMKTYFCDPYASWQKGGTRKLEPLVTTRAAQKHRSSRTNPGGVR